MKISTRRILPFMAAGVLAFQLLAASAFAQGTAFTYQGQLNASGAPANGSYDLAFTLFATNVTGTAIAGPVTNPAVGVTNGLFTTTIDFGAAFTGQSNWLEIAVSTNAANAFTTLAPRQQLTPVPYALIAANVSGQVSLSQLPPSLVTNGATGVTISGTFSGSGAGVTNVPGAIPWQTVPGASVAALPNQAYFLTNNPSTTLTLPATAKLGDIVIVSGLCINGWLVAPPPPQGIAGVFPGIYWTAQNIPKTDSWKSVSSSGDGSKLIAAAYGGPIYTSTNFGLTWSNDNNAPGPAPTGPQWYSSASSADGTKLVAVVRFGGIWTSTDSGITWSTNNNAGTNYWLSVASSADGTHLVAAGSGTWIYTSTDSGITWSTNNNSGSNGWISVASSADGTHLVAVNSGPVGGHIYTSANSGATWSSANNAPLAYWNSVASSADGTHLVAATFQSISQGQIWTSTNSGATWTNNNNAPNAAWQSVSSSADGTRLAAGSYIGAIFTSLDSGLTWSNNNFAPKGGNWESSAWSTNGNFLVAANSLTEQILTSVPAYLGAPGTTTQFQYVGNGLWQPTSLAGTFSGNGAGLSSLQASNLVGALSATNFAATTVTNFPDVPGPLPASFTFTSHGGRFIINAVGSGYPSVAGTIIGMVVQLDGTPITTNRIYGNQIVHITFPAKTLVRTNLSAGSHTITLSTLSGTVTDSGDFFSTTVQELPY